MHICRSIRPRAHRQQRTFLGCRLVGGIYIRRERRNVLVNTRRVQARIWCMIQRCTSVWELGGVDRIHKARQPVNRCNQYNASRPGFSSRHPAPPEPYPPSAFSQRHERRRASPPPNSPIIAHNFGFPHSLLDVAIPPKFLFLDLLWRYTQFSRHYSRKALDAFSFNRL